MSRLVLCRSLFKVTLAFFSEWFRMPIFLLWQSICRVYVSGKVLENLDALFSPKIPACIYTTIWIDMGQADGALGEHLTTMWINFTGWDGFSWENTQSIYFKWSSVIFLKNLDFNFLFLTCVVLFKIHEFKFWL